MAQALLKSQKRTCFSSEKFIGNEVKKISKTKIYFNTIKLIKKEGSKNKKN